MAPTIHQPGGTAPGASQVRLSPVPSRSQAVRVDEQEARSVSFARNDGHDHEPEAQQAPPSRDGHEGACTRRSRAGGPGIPAARRQGGLGERETRCQSRAPRSIGGCCAMTSCPASGSTAAWIGVMMGRLALIVAEQASARRPCSPNGSATRNGPTAWYRLESDDGDLADLHPARRRQRRSLIPSRPGRSVCSCSSDRVVETQGELDREPRRELPEFGASTRDGFTLIFDDYDVIDDSEENTPIVRA